MYILAFLLVPVYLFTGFGTILLGATVAAAVLAIGAALSALLMPWRRADIYRASPVSKYKVGRVPVISIIALIAIAFEAGVGIYTLSNPTYGLVNVPSYVFVGLSFLIWLPVYYAFRWYRKKQGIDIGLCFAAIPPE